LTVDGNHAVHFVDDRFDIIEPQPCAFAGSLGREKWLENFGDFVRCDAASRIGDSDADFSIKEAGFECQCAAGLFHGMDRIGNEIDEDVQ
jgi:hypothetical protein